MLKRLWFPAVALFWVTMNLLLWRSEMSAARVGGSPVPVESVWDRILTAPDDSSLDIHVQGRKVGWCRWVPRVEEEGNVDAGAEPPDEETIPEGRVTRVTGYSLVLDGNVAFDDPTQRVRFSGTLELDRARQWRVLTLRVVVRPNTWELRADAAARELVVRIGEGDGAWEQRFPFEQFGQPEALLGAFGVPLPPGWMQTLFPSVDRQNAVSSLALGLKWEASTDSLQVGTARARGYRVAARLFDKYEVVAVVSRVGEILRLDLPNRVSLVNEVLSGIVPAAR